ncbi:MAG: potassium transporter [Desulfobacterales bacterium]
MDHIWIIGCGRFGKIAIERLCAQKGERTFVMVDKESCSDSGHLQNIKIIKDDGVLFLKKYLTRQNAPNWIIPALPVHLAAQWCMTDSGYMRVKRHPAPKDIKKLLPNPMSGKSGDIHTSMANFKCPDNCPEPEDHCPTTGKKREENLFDRLEKIKIPGFEMLVLRSRQLAPGVGGYRPGELFDLYEKLTEKPGKYLIATSCRCHGAVTCVSVQL